MDPLDPATEWRRLSELYGRMSDGELVALARQKSELTDVAQEALNSEISQRKLSLRLEVPPAPSVPELRLTPYDDDRRLVRSLLWSLADALQLQRLLDVAGIPLLDRESDRRRFCHLQFRQWCQRANHEHWHTVGARGPAELHTRERTGRGERERRRTGRTFGELSSMPFNRSRP